MTDSLAKAKEVAEATGIGAQRTWKLLGEDQVVTAASLMGRGEDEVYVVEAGVDPRVAQFIATFDPETVTALLEAVQAAKDAVAGREPAYAKLIPAIRRVEALLSSKGGRDV